VRWRIFIFVAILVLSSTVVLRTSFASIHEPYIGVYVTNDAISSDTFTAIINISSTVPFVGYQFFLYWNRTYINATSLIDTPPTAWCPYPHVMGAVEWDFNATHSRIIRAAWDTHSPFVAATGNFTVATITFKVLADSSIQTTVRLDLDYEDTMLSNANGEKIKPYHVYDDDVNLIIEKATEPEIPAVNVPTNSSAVRVPSAYVQETYIGVYPSYITDAKASDIFTATINISSTVPFVGYQFYLYWNRTYINATSLTNTPPKAWGSYPYIAVEVEWDYNVTHGRIVMAAMDTHKCSYGTSWVAVTGSFTVATVTFRVLKDLPPLVIVPLELDPQDTFLSDANANMITPYYVCDKDVHLVSNRVTNNNLQPVSGKSTTSAPKSTAKNIPSNKVATLTDFIPVWVPVGAIILVLVIATFNISLPYDYCMGKQDKSRRQNSSQQLEDKKTSLT